MQQSFASQFVQKAENCGRDDSVKNAKTTWLCTVAKYCKNNTLNIRREVEKATKLRKKDTSKKHLNIIKP